MADTKNGKYDIPIIPDGWYKIKIVYRTDWSYQNFCVKNFKYQDWSSIGVIFGFRNIEDATLFALTFKEDIDS